MRNLITITIVASFVAAIAFAKPGNKPSRATDFTTTEILCDAVVTTCADSYPGAPTDVETCVASVHAGPVPIDGVLGWSDLEIFAYFFRASGGSSFPGYCQAFVDIYTN